MAKAKVTKPEEVVEEVVSTEESALIEEAPQVTLNEAPSEVPQAGHGSRDFKTPLS